jgi:hypothetical protein
MGAEPTAVDHAPQRGNTPLEPALHLVVVADNEGGRFDPFTHDGPPRGTPAGASSQSAIA